MHQLKALMCGINASRGQEHGCRFTMCHASLKMALLLHKEGLVKTTVPITVPFVARGKFANSFTRGFTAREGIILFLKIRMMGLAHFFLPFSDHFGIHMIFQGN